MTNVEKLKEVIEESGLRKSFIAKRLNITPQGYWKKENGQSDFTASEVAIMKDLLNLSAKQTAEIFLSN